MQREKVQASVKTRLKGNRRLSAGRSWCQKPKREPGEGGGTRQGRGPINPGLQLIGGYFYLKCGGRALECLHAFSDILKVLTFHTNASHPPPPSKLHKHASAHPPGTSRWKTERSSNLFHHNTQDKYSNNHRGRQTHSTEQKKKHICSRRRRNTQSSALVRLCRDHCRPGDTDEGLQVFLVHHSAALEHLSLHLNTICSLSWKDPGPSPQSD